MRFWYGGAPFHPGTTLPSNVTGECPHMHRSPDAAQRCIDARNRAIKRGHGNNAYCDRVVMMAHAVKHEGAWLQISGTTRRWETP